MDTEHAKSVLLTYRLGEAAPLGSELAEALALAERNFDLAAWLEQELRFDRSMRQLLRAVPAPAGLRASIVLGRPADIVRPRWSRPSLLAVAAAVIGVLGFVILRSVNSTDKPVPLAQSAAAPSFDAFHQEMATLIAEGRYSLQETSTSLAELKRYIRQNRGVADAAIPSRLAALPTYGCQILNWRGQRVTLICFTSAQLGFVHLFVLDADSQSLPVGSTEMVKVSDWNTARWRAEGKSYLLVAQGTDAQLRSLAGT